MKKRSKERENRFRRYGLSSTSRDQNGRLGRTVSIILLEGLGKNLWSILCHHMGPRVEAIALSISRVICHPYLAWVIKLKGGDEQWEILRTDLYW
jgi:hypothetical protein